ncbi:MAG: hypothetical protein H0U65_11515 [Rubrobacter sp.]|nr:hypothetical protein [Rubrobacter sp.]
MPPFAGGAGNGTLLGGSRRGILRVKGGSDRLLARDGVCGNDIANGGPGRDSCQAEPRDRRVNCP